jgi:diphthamide synthase (EF-2-diphthine--ammonia ligase)
LGIEKFLGSYIDDEIINEMVKAGVTPCGEKGEFHTIVTNGHHFIKRLNILSGHKYSENGYEFYDIDGFTIDGKLFFW